MNTKTMTLTGAAGVLAMPAYGAPVATAVRERITGADVSGVVGRSYALKWTATDAPTSELIRTGGADG